MAHQLRLRQGHLHAGAQRELDQLLRDLLVASGTAVEVHGHTDSQGNPQANMKLSEERAFAVKQWLEQQSPVNFPAGRVRVFAHGQENPVAPNTTAEGRAQNRRVEIVLGTTGTDVRRPVAHDADGRRAARLGGGVRAEPRRLAATVRLHAWLVAGRRRALALLVAVARCQVLPRPAEVLRALRALWFEQGLGRELITSFGLNLQALASTLVISLLLSYLTVVPFFRPIAAARVARGASWA